jgi:hypothetical protein
MMKIFETAARNHSNNTQRAKIQRNEPLTSTKLYFFCCSLARPACGFLLLNLALCS